MYLVTKGKKKSNDKVVKKAIYNSKFYGFNVLLTTFLFSHFCQCLFAKWKRNNTELLNTLNQNRNNIKLFYFFCKMNWILYKAKKCHCGLWNMLCFYCNITKFSCSLKVKRYCVFFLRSSIYCSGCGCGLVVVLEVVVVVNLTFVNWFWTRDNKYVTYVQWVISLTNTRMSLCCHLPWKRPSNNGKYHKYADKINKQSLIVKYTAK